MASECCVHGGSSAAQHMSKVPLLKWSSYVVCPTNRTTQSKLPKQGLATCKSSQVESNENPGSGSVHPEINLAEIGKTKRGHHPNTQ